MKPPIKYFLYILLVFCALTSNKDAKAGGGCQDFSITSFNQVWCQTAPYPTAYVTVSFAITEDFDNVFRKGENSKTLIVDLPAGFEFNQASVTATVSNSIAGDISACTFVYNSATQIALTISTINSYNFIDSILFDNFEIRATVPGIFGPVLRSGGDFKIDGTIDCPGDGVPNPAEQLGYLFADLPMIYDSSTVVQDILVPIRRTCGVDQPMLEIQVSVTNACSTPITQFTFNTNGDVGYSLNPATNITSANLYYTGTVQGYSPSNLFASVASPNGAFVFNGTQNLSSAGTHYFYLAYDVPITANIGDGLDARLDSFVFAGADITDMTVSNPAGFRNIIDTVCLQPDIPNPNANPQLVKSGSLVIPMDITNQSLVAPFNLGAYGLIHNLLLNDVPVRWVIRSGKTRNDTDFSALAERKWPTVVAPAVTEFRAGAFVIDSQWVTAPFSQYVLDATSIINNFGNSVAVFELKEDKILDVRYEMNQRPKIAVFSNGGNQAIHIAILNQAGLTPIDTANPLAGGSYVTVAAGLFTGIDECYTFASEPHWAGTLADSLTTDNIRKFILSGGNFLAQCRGVDTYENFSLINIVSTKGISIVNQTVNHEYHNSDLAYMQFEGDVVENEGGSERNWVLANGSAWRPGFYYGISDSSNSDTIVTSGAHIISPDSVGGNVFYLGGHDYAVYNTVEQINAARMYMNATLIPSGRPTLFTLDPGDTLFGCVGSPIQLGGSPTGPADATYIWSPGSFLDDSTSQNPIATPPDSITYSVLAYRGGCIVGPFPVTINATPAPVVDAGLDQSICGNVSTISLTGSVLEATSGIWSTNGSGTFANDTALITTYSPTPADLLIVNIEIYLHAVGGCDTTASDTMLVDFTAIPTVNAGPDISICDTFGVALSGLVTVAAGGTWTTNGTGTFSPDADSLIATYTPTAADTALPNLILTLTTTGNGGCNAEYDSLIIDFATVIYVNAGPDQTFCGSVSTAVMAGTILTATGGIWSSSSGGTFSPNDTIPTSTYNMSSTDSASGIVTIVLTTTGNGTCAALQDSLVITVIPSVNAGPDTIVCDPTDTVGLNGFVENQIGAVWSTIVGTGTFFPSDSAMNGNYILSPADLLLGSIDLYVATLDSAGCAFRDTMNISITPPATATVGPDDTICTNSNQVLIGSLTNASGSIWSSSGGGSFSPAPDSLIATFIPDTSGIDTITLTTVGSCNNASDFMILNISNGPVVDAGPDFTICDTGAAPLNGTIAIATGGTWTTNGGGTFSPSADSLNTNYFPVASDTSLGGLFLVLTSTGNGTCAAEIDSLFVTFSLVIYTDAGPDITICADSSSILVSGTVTSAGALWTTNGTGTFDDSTLLAATYTPSTADTTIGTITLTLTSTGNGSCAAVVDSMILTITPAPTVSAGSDQTVCANNAVITVSGSVDISTGGVWTTDGSGTFGDSSLLTTTYTPSAADTVAGAVNLTLTSSGNGICKATSDQIILTITPAPIVIAGADQTICANTSGTLAGTVLNASGGTWTTDGSGTFGNDTLLNTTYIPSATDTTVGFVTLTLTTTGNGTCFAESDELILTFTPAPVVNAGPSQSVCENNALVTLLGSVSIGTTSGVWTSSGTGLFANDTAMNTTYTPSIADIALGSVVITLTSTANGTCQPTADTLVITFTAPPTADADVDQTICANAGGIILNGSVTIATGGTWTTSGTGTFSPDSNTLNATYAPSAADTTAGTVALVLTTTGNGGCASAADAMVLTITPAPQVTAGTDQTVCADNPIVSLNGVVTVATGGTWSGGAGTYSPDSTTLTATYTPTPSEISSGSVILVLTSTGNAGCLAEIDSIVITIAPSPIVVAGPDTIVCSDNGIVPLQGTVTFAGGGVWSTSGTGVFDNTALLNATYTASSADSASGSVTLTLTSTANGSCNPISDDMVLSFFAGIFVSASTDTTVCLADSMLLLSGNVSGGTSTGQWTSTSGGTFTPNDSTLNATYVFSPLDMVTGSITLILTSTNNGFCNPVVDSMSITLIPGVNAGPDTVVCNNADTIQLNGTVENIATSQWTTTGTGVFFPNDTSLTAQYILTAADIASGSIAFILTSADTAGLCPSGTDSMQVTIIPPSSVNAGSDNVICEDSAGVALIGSFANASSVLWTSTGGGTFFPQADTTNVIYSPGAAGIDTLVFNAVGSCDNNSDTLYLNVTPAPTVSAGADTSVCATLFNVALGGTFTVSNGAIWSTTNGTGTFTPSDTSMNPTYNGTPADTAFGTVEIILTTTGNGDCNVHSDTMYLTYTPNLISVDAGPDTIVCNSSPGISLNGVIQIATGGTWTTAGTGTFVPSPDSLDATYVPSGADTMAGSITLTLSTTGNGGCATLTDDMVVTFFALPSVVAGADTTVCYTTDTIFLSGSVANAGGAIWSTNGTGVFSPNDSTLNAGYVPSVADFLNETVTLYLTTYLTCNDITDSIVIDIVPGVRVFPSDTIVCNDVDTIPISGIVTGAAGGIWATSGTGTFSPNDTSMSTNYIPSSGDSALGTIVITLTTTGVLMGCPPATDFLNIIISPPPIIDAGADQFVCSNQDSVSLTGTAVNAGGLWTTSGSGTFIPDSITLNATYVLSPADISNGSVTLTLTATSSCVLVSDSFLIGISPPPTANFTSTNVCLDSTSTFTDISSGNLISWLWDFDGIDTSTNSNPEFLFVAAGTYNVMLTVVDQNGCSDLIVETVTVHQSPIVDFNSVDVCNEDTMFFFNASTPIDSINSYSWDFDDASTSTTPDPFHVYQNNGVYIVTLTAVSNQGCTSTWDTLVVVSPTPVAAFDANPKLVNTEEEIDFTDLSSGSSEVPDTIIIDDWSWNFYYPANVSGGFSSQPNPTILYGDTGLFTIQLIVTNEYGCKDTAYQDVQVGLHPIVASGFSPDGSGADGNNILVVHGGPYPELQFVIFNEWGEVVFKSNNQDDGWDGTFKGVPQPIGVYVYTVVATSLDGKVHHFWGDVTLLR